MTFSAAEIEGDKSLDALGEEVAKKLAKGSTRAELEYDDAEMTLGEPQQWSRGGLEGVTMDGTLSDPELTIQLEMLVVVADDSYLVAFGFRGPGATANQDEAMQAMLESLRKAG